ncbi:hypothetical protein SKAU_G00226310 [Synaphobranchus kaupii]|uniref:Uncharacterized protein n=1 Tax=Synaphobranchus kaupii TaxID=118154 RepID=A0A9Q1F4V7_SYNKA|nr:hypothetical protein SKAU_G00226310 [Synaphobranchus kaupii]
MCENTHNSTEVRNEGTEGLEPQGSKHSAPLLGWERDKHDSGLSFKDLPSSKLAEEHYATSASVTPAHRKCQNKTHVCLTPSPVSPEHDIPP